MKNSYLNYSIDMTILITGLLCGITGLIKWPGLVYALGLSYQGLPLDAITQIHDWAGLIMLLCAMIHVVLHFRWLIAMTKKLLHDKGIKNEPS
jgi:cytochrome b subunit of formate dehydrogenase